MTRVKIDPEMRNEVQLRKLARALIALASRKLDEKASLPSEKDAKAKQPGETT